MNLFEMVMMKLKVRMVLDTQKQHWKNGIKLELKMVMDVQSIQLNILWMKTSLLTGHGYGVNIGANFGCTFFGGAYFPQKWDLLPPFQPRFKLFQGHVLSY
jgi:hypothetical protein